MALAVLVRCVLALIVVPVPVPVALIIPLRPVPEQAMLPAVMCPAQKMRNLLKLIHQLTRKPIIMFRHSVSPSHSEIVRYLIIERYHSPVKIVRYLMF
jgi:hypothetical protein